jgi:hypothetical protein
MEKVAKDRWAIRVEGEWFVARNPPDAIAATIRMKIGHNYYVLIRESLITDLASNTTVLLFSVGRRLVVPGEKAEDGFEVAMDSSKPQVRGVELDDFRNNPDLMAMHPFDNLV